MEPYTGYKCIYLNCRTNYTRNIINEVHSKFNMFKKSNRSNSTHYTNFIIHLQALNTDLFASPYTWLIETKRFHLLNEYAKIMNGSEMIFNVVFIKVYTSNILSKYTTSKLGKQYMENSMKQFVIFQRNYEEYILDSDFHFHKSKHESVRK